MSHYAREPLRLILPSCDEERRYLVLEAVCPDCEGKGERPNEYDRYKSTCSYCDGRGVVLNDNGRTIIELMSSWAKSKDSDVLLAQKGLY